MPAPFDAYYTWLGIPPSEQPPHYYRLLGVPPYETDMAVIGNAADRQMVYVKTFVDGPHAETAQRVLTELRAARLCLFDAEKKEDYDATLQNAVSARGSTSGSGLVHSAESASHPSVARPLPRRAFSSSAPSEAPQLPPKVLLPAPIPPPVSLPPISLPPGAAAPPVATIPATPSAVPAVPVETRRGGYFSGTRLRDKQMRSQEALLIAGGATLGLIVLAGILAYSFSGRPDRKEKPVARDQSSESSAEPGTPKPDVDAQADSDPSGEESSIATGKTKRPQAKKPRPKPGKTRIQPRNSKAKPAISPDDAAEKPADAADLAGDPDPSDSELPAVNAGSADAPTKPVDSKETKGPVKVGPPKAVVASLEGDAFKEPLARLKEFTKANKTDDERMEAADEALSLVTPLLAERRLDDADKMAKKAKEISDYYESLKKKNPDLKLLAQSAQIEVNHVRRMQTALELLKKSPQDGAANLAAGKYYCLVEGNFTKGLSFLAKGDDPDLNEAALLDLTSPTEPSAQAKVGDAWFELGKEDGGFFARAALWYRLALPELSTAAKRGPARRLTEISADTVARKLRRRPGVNLVGARENLTLVVSEHGKLAGHEGGTHFVVFLPDQKTLVSAGADNTIRRWDLADGAAPVELKGHIGKVTAVAVVEDGQKLFSSSADGKLRLWESDKSQEFPGGSSRVTFVALSIDGRSLASAGSDGKISFWGLIRGNQRPSFQAHDGPVACLAFSANGQTLASAGDRSVKLWTLLGQLKATLNHSAAVNTVALSPDGKLIASGGADNAVEIWSAETYERREPLAGHRAAITSVAFSPDGASLASADSAGEIHFWSLASGKKLTSPAPLKNRVHHLAYAPEGGMLAAACENGEIVLFDIKLKFGGPDATAQASEK